MTRQTELAWAAGFWDGEGHTHKNDHIRVSKNIWKMSVAQTDRIVLDRFQAAVDVGKIVGPTFPKQANHNPYWTWRATSKADCLLVVEQLWPYLSEVKRSQIVNTGITRESKLGVVRFTKGTKVLTPDGLKGTVRTVETIRTGKPGRPKTEVTVKTKNGNEVFSPSQLSVPAV